MIQHNLLEQFLRKILLVYHRFPTRRTFLVSSTATICLKEGPESSKRSLICRSTWLFLGFTAGFTEASGLGRYGPSTCGHPVAAACLSHEGTATFVIVSCQSSKTGSLRAYLGKITRRLLKESIKDLAATSTSSA